MLCLSTKNIIQWLLVPLLLPLNTILGSGLIFEEITDVSFTSSVLPRKKKCRVEKWIGENKLSLILVEDPDLQDSTISILIRVGFLHPPLDKPIAQLVEHSFGYFGNKMFPKEHSIQKFVSQRGGTFLSWTGPGYTLIMSQCDSKFLEGVTARYNAAIKHSDFSNIEELKKDIIHRQDMLIENQDQAIDWIMWQNTATNESATNRSLIDKTILDSITKEEIQNWFLENYKPSNITIILVTNLNLEQIRHSGLSLLSYSFPIESKKQNTPTPIEIKNNKFIYMDSHNRQLKLTWKLSDPIPPAKKDEICIVLGLDDKSENSFKKILERQKLANDIVCDIEETGNMCGGIFTISISLLPDGVKRWKEVAGKTIYAIKNVALNNDLDSIVAEEQVCQSLRWMYPKKYTSMQTSFLWISSLICEPIETAPRESSVPAVIDKDPQIVAENIVSKPFTTSLEAPFEEWIQSNDDISKPETKDEFYTKFNTKWNLPIFILDSIKVPIITLEEDIILPVKNIFVPPYTPKPTIEPDDISNDFNLVPLIISNEDGRSINLIFEKCFGEPKTLWNIEISPPKDVLPVMDQIAKEKICYSIISKKLETLMLMAHKSNNLLNVYSNGRRLNLQTSCWEFTENNVINEILFTISDRFISEEMLDECKEEIRASVKKLEVLSSKEIAFEEFIRITSKQSLPNIYQYIEILNIIDQITPQDISEKMEEIFSNYLITVLHFGKNIEEMKITGETIFSYLKGPNKVDHPLSKKDLEKVEFFNSKSRQPNNVIAVGIKTGESFSPETYVFTSILTKELDKIFTKWLSIGDQEGNYSKISLVESGGDIYILIILQCAHAESTVLSKQIRDFLISTIEKFDTPSVLNLDKFENLRVEYRKSLNASPNSLEELGERIYKIATERYNWTFWERAVKAAENLSYEQFKLFALSNLNPYTNKSTCVFVEGSNKT